MSTRTVVEWSVTEKAADHLFNIWTDRFDLHWARSVWKTFPQVDDGDDQCAVLDSLVTLVALGLLSQALWNVAIGEPFSELDFEIDDALIALAIHPFWIGVLWAESPSSLAIGNDGAPHMSHVVRDLAIDRLPEILRSLTKDHANESETLRFFISLSAAELDEETRVEVGQHAWTEGSDVWEKPVDAFGSVIQWLSNGCPLPR
jgi:hypothetical protein